MLTPDIEKYFTNVLSIAIKKQVAIFQKTLLLVLNKNLKYTVLNISNFNCTNKNIKNNNYY